ncbi:hypothetical protein [[Phormidium] sp. ETS-05]|uniref:hypothetical protein n=1 Tax=[Phormidium] sp. ETS-05 TaxID=222819 RepID=UPI0018EED752|nr:hypothetical protein [[Phormidium] sp. ETS-05]
MSAPIYFYIPQADWPDSPIPDNADTYWAGFGGNLTSGVYAWTVQTYLRLKHNGFPCELTGKLPEQGIVLAHRSSLPFHLQPGDKLVIVCLKADYDKHPYAQIHIVLNQEETQNLAGSYYMPHWIQSGLIPRDAGRGDRFENIAYFGIEKNLAPELRDPAWAEKLQELGLNWRVVSRERWHDFSDVDAILAVRNFAPETDYKWKPASKLVNAWHAGVPAILGCESAYQAERQSELDYMEVTSVDEAIKALQRLRDDQDLRHKMVENGQFRAQSTTPKQLTERWQKFLTDVAIPEYDRWCSSSKFTKQIYIAKRYLAIKENRLQPNPVYPHDRDISEPTNLGMQQQAIISLMQAYRKIRRFLLR